MENNVENSIKFTDLLYLFISKLWIMILVAVIAGGSIFAVRYVTYEEKYKSTASIYILRQESSDDESNYNSDFSLALSVVNDCTTLLTSRAVLLEVIQENNLSYSYEQLSSMISINNPQSTRYLEISVLSDSPETSKMLVDSICNIGKDKIVSIMGFNQVNIVDEGTLASEPSNSVLSISIILGAIVGFILTYVIAIVIFVFDDRINNPEDVEKYLDLSTLGVVPNTENEKGANPIGIYQGKNATQRYRYYTKSNGQVKK